MSRQLSLNYDAGMESKDIMRCSENEGLRDGLRDLSMKQTSNVLLSLRIV